MFNIRKVTQSIGPRACIPDFSCAPSAVCHPNLICTPDSNLTCIPDLGCNPSLTCIPNLICVPDIHIRYQNVSGTYKSPTPVGQGKIIELRVDVDGRRPQSRVSGDIFQKYSFWGFTFTLYSRSFVVETLTVTEVSNEMVITGAVKYYDDPGNNKDTIEVRIPRVTIFQASADATVKFYTSGVLQSTYVCDFQKPYFRTVDLEIDRFQGTGFPPTVDTHTDPFPADLTDENLTTAIVYQRAGIDMTVTEDDVLNDPDGPDQGNNWSETELHDLMENRFDHFANNLQWNLYGVIVPWFGGVNSDTGYYGTMFDWGGWQIGDTYLRQGLAVAYNATIGRTSGTLYDTAAKRDRLLLQTFIHEVGHAFNLPHTWQRTVNPDSGSESFMNYPWGHTNGERSFWENFRWEFDDVELAWVCHADRNDVIFGGRDWIGNNLSIYTEPQFEIENSPLALELRMKDVYEFGEPVQAEVKLKNISAKTQPVVPLLEPEDGLVHIYIRRLNGEAMLYSPPVRRLKAWDAVSLKAGESLYATTMLSYSSKGPLFAEPGEYHLRVFYSSPLVGMIVSPRIRIRIAAPAGRENDELAYLLFDPAAAKFVYFGGSERHPEVTSQLAEAVDRYSKSNPYTVRHIHAALGLHQSSPVKIVIEKRKRRYVSTRAANLDEAIRHLQSARELFTARKISALNNISYNRISWTLTDCFEQQGKNTEARTILDEGQAYLKRRGVLKSVLQSYQSRLEQLPKK